MGINCAHCISGRGTHGGCEYKCVSVNVRESVGEGLERERRGGKAEGRRVMGVIPGKETSEGWRASL